MQPRMRHNRKWKIHTCVSVSTDRMLRIVCTIFALLNDRCACVLVFFYSPKTYCTHFFSTLYQPQIKLFAMWVFFGVNRIKPLRNRINISHRIPCVCCAIVRAHTSTGMYVIPWFYTRIFYVRTTTGWASEWVRDTCSAMLHLWIIIYWNFCRSLTSSARWFISNSNVCMYFFHWWSSFKINVVNVV